MELKHNEQFCLSSTLKSVTPLLPIQGPIKDFIHLNILQNFVDRPFHNAVVEAAELFDAKPYMDLSFYRDKYRCGEITEQDLNQAIKEQCQGLSNQEYDALHHALFNFSEVIDQKSFNHLVKAQKVSTKIVESACLRASRIAKKKSRVSFRALMNQKLNSSIDHDVNAMLFRLLGSYLDQGVILWPLLDECATFKSAVIKLVKESILPLAYFVDNQDFLSFLSADAEVGIRRVLGKIFCRESFYGDYIKESLLNHRGWSGMVHFIEHNKESLAKRRNISLEEMLLVKLALEWQFIKHKDPHFVAIKSEDIALALEKEQSSVSTSELSLAYWLLSANDAFAIDDDFAQKIEFFSLERIWHIALETNYYESIEKKLTEEQKFTNADTPKKFQVIFCMDDREGSFRRHLEAQDPAIETFGFPGFFGIEFYFKSHKKDLLEKMCPPPVTPNYLVMERESKTNKKAHNKLLEFASFVSRHGANSLLLGFISAYTLGHLSAFRLLFSFLHPSLLKSSNRRTGQSEKTELVFARPLNQEKEHGLLVGFTEEEMADRVFNALKNMGLTKNIAPMVFAIAHGSSSVNNPHFAGYDCGACSGRPGNINARLFATIANIKNVRALVAERGIIIPDDTVFVGGIHDTCTDEVKLFDIDKLNAEHRVLLKEFVNFIAVAQGKNAKERCRRFALVTSTISEKDALKETSHRAKALFEPRPELGHATNALCIVGRRHRTYGKNFDRRAFLQSYDPTNDKEGVVLANIMNAVIPVCGGINFDYYFSRVDPAVYGCGSKLSHNVCSLIGVGNGLDDDLRTGIPIQMTEIHDPVRLLIIIEQTPEIIEKAVFANKALKPWVVNDWVKLASLDPLSNALSFYDCRSASYQKARKEA